MRESLHLYNAILFSEHLLINKNNILAFRCHNFVMTLLYSCRYMKVAVSWMGRKDQRFYHNKRQRENGKFRITSCFFFSYMTVFSLLNAVSPGVWGVCKNHKYCIAYLGEPSPPSIHGQPSSGKSFKLSITKQDDGGAPILEYIVKYRSVSTFLLSFCTVFSNCIKYALNS